MKLIGKKKQLDSLWYILEKSVDGNSQKIPWEEVKKWLKDNCEWKK